VTMTPEEDRAFRAAVDSDELRIELDALDAFAAVEEPGADALLGDSNNALFPEGGDVMVYGDGGAGKTTLIVDAALHLGAGEDWLGIPVQRVARVLLIENEGPRALLRRKLRRRLDAWEGATSDVRVLRSPWAKFTFASEEWRTALAKTIDEHEIDVVVAGPLTRIGMSTAGTLQDVVEFVALLEDLRGRCARSLTVVLIHHQGKSGSVSGAWEGAGDTLLHVKSAGPGHTLCTVQKARWASDYHGKTFKLEWTAGGGFAPEVERDLPAEIEELLTDGQWRTVEEIRDEVKAGTKAVRQVVEDDDQRFVMLTGERARELGRSAKARLYGRPR
jgi:hypothetical protein